MVQLGFCNTDNCRRCYKKFSCQQYLSYLENVAMSPIGTSNLNGAAATIENSISSLDVNKIISDIEELKLSTNAISEKLDYLVSIFQQVEVSSDSEGLQVKAQGNSHTEDNSEVGMIVYNGDDDSEKTLVQRKGLLGLGKAKWVEEK